MPKLTHGGARPGAGRKPKEKDKIIALQVYVEQDTVVEKIGGKKKAAQRAAQYLRSYAARQTEKKS